MGYHYGLGLPGDGLLQQGAVYVVGRQRHVHEHRHRAVLYYRRNSGRETRRNCYNLVAGLYLPRAQFGRGQRHKGDKVGRGAGVNKGNIFNAQVGAQLFLKFRAVAAGGQPEVQRRVGKVYQFLVVVHAPTVINKAFAGLKGRALVELLVVGRNLLEDLSAGFCFLLGHMLLYSAICFRQTSCISSLDW